MRKAYDEKAYSIGSFIIIYLIIGSMVVISLLTLGLNPTLVISVVSAPIWIGIIFLSQGINNKMRKTRKRKK
tara:strand:- start:70 stop:285 length:216 start_codon:yes stop_codon:yes gene_type:complete